MNRLPAKDIKAYREQTLEAQGYKCALCGNHCSLDQAVLDHEHKSGHIRGVLHRGCNALLGRVENNAPRHGVPLSDFARGLAQYLTQSVGILHPSHRTADERKILAKKRAKRRKALKVYKTEQETK